VGVPLVPVAVAVGDLVAVGVAVFVDVTVAVGVGPPHAPSNVHNDFTAAGFQPAPQVFVKVVFEWYCDAGLPKMTF
jgi:hypothetical protein